MYWSADSAPIGDTKGRGRVDAVGDRCRPEYCRDRQLITVSMDYLLLFHYIHIYDRFLLQYQDGRRIIVVEVFPRGWVQSLPPQP